MFPRWLVLMLCLVGCLSAQASAQRGVQEIVVRLPSSGKDLRLYSGSYAVVVGVSDYAYWPHLPNAVQDAEEVGEALRRLGFEVRVVRNPNRQVLEDVLKDLEFSTGVENDRLLFYFAGHGETETLANKEELGYIVPVDAPLKSLDPRGFVDRAISMQRIDQCAKRIRFKHALFVFDSCFSGSIFTLQRAAPQNITEKTSLAVRQFVTAGGKDETVPDESVFKKCFLRALSGEGDLTEDGYVTGTELGIYLNEQVVNYSKGTQHPQAGKLRDPELDRGDFVFVAPGAMGSGGTASPPPPKPITPPPPPVSFGHLQVNVNAPGCKVYVDGAYRGDAGPGTPLNLQNVGSKEVEVRVESTGYRSATKRFALTPGEWTQAVFELLVIPSPAPTPLPTPPVVRPQLEPAPPAGVSGEDMVYIPPGEFEMGSTEAAIDRLLRENPSWQRSWFDDEKPVHTVYVDGFWMDKTEVTVAQYRKYKPGYTPSDKSSCDECPATNVNWEEAKAYCESQGKRLPTEAEWEKACRGPQGYTYSWGNSADKSKGRFDLGWEDGAVRVGSYAANGYGLYDMSGNVWEWCADWYDKGYYSKSPSRNPEGPKSGGSSRVLRGGSWCNLPHNVRCPSRIDYHPDLRLNHGGFRCAR